MEKKKTDMKIKISGKMLSQAKSMESVLAKEEARKLEDAIPEDHPLMAEVNKAKAALGGDLSGLPPGHPLLRALESAKKNREAKMVVGTGKGGASPEVKMVKKIDPEKARQEAKRMATRQADDANDKKKEAAGDVNRRIDALLGETKELFRVVEESEAALGIDPFSRSKVARLKRLLFATERGISGCRIARF